MKIFISQPMGRKTHHRIRSERRALIETILRDNPDAQIVDSYIEDHPDGANSIWYIGESLKKLSQADLAVFTDDWQDAPGCVLEHKACELYGLPIKYAKDYQKIQRYSTKIVELLKQILKQHPRRRVGQILADALYADADMYYLEDRAICESLRSYADECEAER